MVTEVERLEATLLVQQNNESAAGPVETFPKQLPAMQTIRSSAKVHLNFGVRTCALYALDGVLVSACRDAVDKLNGAPQAMELRTFVDTHNAVVRRRTRPDGVV